MSDATKTKATKKGEKKATEQTIAQECPPASLLIYDIPSSSNLENPSGRLRRNAVRVNLSCWVIPTADIPHHLLSELSEGGATWYTVKFEASEAATIVQMVTEAVKKEVREAINRSREDAEQAFDRWTGRAEYRGRALSREERLEKFKIRATHAADRVEELIEEVTEAAGRFGVTPQTLRLQWATGALNAIRTATERRVEEWKAATEALKARTAPDSNLGAVAAAAEADALPAGILADAVDDAGGDASELRAAFAGEPGSMIEGQPADENKYSLAGAEDEAA